MAVLLWAFASLEADAAPLRTGNAFRQALAGTVGISWEGTPLREALARLGETQGIAIVLDRRMDPDQMVEFATRGQTLESSLRQLAARLKAGMAIVDSTVYIGPESTAQRLATSAVMSHEAGQRLPAELRRGLASLPETTTDELATPRELLTAWSGATGVRIEGIERIPHDLWPSLRLPKQSGAARAALLLAGFDLALAFSPPGGARVVPLPERPRLERTYTVGTVATAGSVARQRSVELRQEFPEAEIEVRGGVLHVTARWEDHELIGRFLRGERIVKSTAKPPEELFSLKVERQPVGAIARTIAQRVGKELVIDPAVQEKTNERATFDVTNVKLEVLLEKLLDPVGLTYRVTQSRLEIRAKP
jgi:hypothetical protein